MVEQSEESFQALDPQEKQKRAQQRPTLRRDTAFGCLRDFLDNRFVYTVFSSRARGLSIGINMNPDSACNFDCVYCEVKRGGETPREQPLIVEVMAEELKKTLTVVGDGRLRERPWFRSMPEELFALRQVALSGDGEPTLAPNFFEAVEAVVHVRALGAFPFFKLVLITNGTGLDQPQVRQGLKLFTNSDEVWVKLDGGTQAYLDKVNKMDVPLEKLLGNILDLGRQRPVVIQSLFPAINREGPPREEIQQYAERLRELRVNGAQIRLVQIYSATRPTPNSSCGHLSLKMLSQIAQTVRQIAGLKAEVF